MEWNGHCTRWHVQPALFNLGWTMTLGLLSGEDSHSRCTSSTPWSIFCPGLTRSMFFCSAVLAAQHALLTVPCYVSLFHCLWDPSALWVTSRHDGAPRSFTSRTRWFQINYTVHSRSECGCGTAEKYMCILKFFTTWILLFNVFNVQRTITYNIHTDTACVQHVNVGLTQARPNNWKCLGFLSQQCTHCTAKM